MLSSVLTLYLFFSFSNESIRRWAQIESALVVVVQNFRSWKVQKTGQTLKVRSYSCFGAIVGHACDSLILLSPHRGIEENLTSHLPTRYLTKECDKHQRMEPNPNLAVKEDHKSNMEAIANI